MSAAYLVVPPTLRRLRVARRTLDETRVLLSGPGEEGLEAAVLWLGHVLSTSDARVDAVMFPRQIAYRTDEGLAVEIPAEEWTSLGLSLPVGYLILAKLHTHSADAYHSHVDAANPYMRYEGAFAITVPHFASQPFDTLDGWSVNVFRKQRWVELLAADIPDVIVVEEG